MKRKKNKSNGRTNNASGSEKREIFTAAGKTVERWEPWLPWVIALLYTLVMGYLTFRYHRIGGMGVETDFYVELVPQAKKLIGGMFSPLNYGAKGPVYSILLAGVYLIVRDYFYAGLVLNLLSSAVFLSTAYFLIREVFNSVTALVVTIAISCNYVFQSYTYQAGSDMPFMAVCALSMYFLFRSGRTRDLVLSAVFGTAAFLSRYNGAFIVMGTVLFFALQTVSVRERLKRAALWIGVFLLVGLPWFIPNWKATGNPVHNDNYMNVMLEFYGLGKEGVTYENWTDALPKEFTGMGDIILYDPLYFAGHVGHNVVTHFVSDIQLFTGMRLGIFVILGMVLFWFARPGRKRLLFYSFGLLYFLILTLVFYNVRFSLFLLVFYLPTAVWPLTHEAILDRLKRYSWLPGVILLLVVLSYFYTTATAITRELKQSPVYLEDLRDLGRAVDRSEPDKTKTIIGRKPHVAYFAGLEARMFPGDVKSIPELVDYCRDNGIDYILYSGIEASSRPYVRDLLNVGTAHRGLEKVYHNRFGAVYRVTDVKR